MRSHIIGVLSGLCLVAAMAAPSLACPFHDQQASAATQQQTADAQKTTTTSTQ